MAPVLAASVVRTGDFVTARTGYGIARASIVIDFGCVMVTALYLALKREKEGVMDGLSELLLLYLRCIRAWAHVEITKHLGIGAENISLAKRLGANYKMYARRAHAGGGSAIYSFPRRPAAGYLAS